ncbi:T9SS type B sorting domain-containing protein [Tamlana sp. 2201CG12-4]|uniref:T9SS type B sorting domain-containing protein n=1 Tax=Tamlana sp. 2201CG12-4 TaxID=3112582 RepID=UPI002DBC90F8|nr:T9SS type B sorting domain-containing protein [Tamlana sp. 2201CG12-4]MEC3907441.1 T9SS type B sorting domain-containing protein [Tamlana sp. 2201CG12-4]
MAACRGKRLRIFQRVLIYITKITSTTPVTICGSGTGSLSAEASVGDVLWFDTLTSTTPLFKGDTYTTPNISASTTYYALASINDCIEGVRVAVEATVTSIPVISSVTDDLVCELGSGTLLATASAGTINWYESPTGGISVGTGTSFTTPVLNSTTNYYVDATVNDCTTTIRTPVVLTVQKTDLPTGNSNQSFCDIDHATVADLMANGTDIQWYSSSSGGTALSLTDTLTSSIYYASQIINTCESPARLPVTVLIHETVVPPTLADIPLIQLCDDDLDGDDANGFTTFDLTTNQSVILNGKSDSDFTLRYFFTDISGTKIEILSPKTFINTVKDTQIIDVRIENKASTTCYTETSFTIRVNALPVINSSIDFKNCDSDGNPDGFTNFNLNEADGFITNNATGLNISYHLSRSEADSNTGAINASAFNNSNSISNMVYARVETSLGCHRICDVNLQVSATSFSPDFYEELELCDYDGLNDGYHEFDLSLATGTLMAELPAGQNLTISYYRNAEDAQLEQNEIIGVYRNEVPYSQPVYVRVESEDNGACFGIGPHLLLTVNPLPEFEIDQTEVYCLDNTSISLFTFNPKGDYTYEWTDENGAVVSTEANVSVNTGGVYNVIATSDYGCESESVRFEVVESAIANIGLDDIKIVELSDNNSIEINNSNNNLGIGDYEFALNDINGPYKGDPYFDRVGAGTHIIYVRDKNKCGIAELEVFILGFPKYFTPNGDTFNETWQIKGLGNDYTNASKVSIYDRYGKLIKQLSAKNGFWDGTFNGQVLPNSDYWFVAKLDHITAGVKIFKGHFSLLR